MYTSSDPYGKGDTGISRVVSEESKVSEGGLIYILESIEKSYECLAATAGRLQKLSYALGADHPSDVAEKGATIKGFPHPSDVLSRYKNFESKLACLDSHLSLLTSKLEQII